MTVNNLSAAQQPHVAVQCLRQVYQVLVEQLVLGELSTGWPSWCAMMHMHDGKAAPPLAGIWAVVRPSEIFSMNL